MEMLRDYMMHPAVNVVTIENLLAIVISAEFAREWLPMDSHVSIGGSKQETSKATQRHTPGRLTTWKTKI
jgi:hypothetical protein